jgi:hypothetical protein
MSQFEQDIRTSLNTIQTQLAAVESKANSANSSIARMAPSARSAAGGVNEVEKSLGKVRAAATRAGGPIGGMITQLGGLAAFNPLALAAGAAIGGITAGVYSLIAALREANAEQEKLNAARAAAPGMAKAAGIEALAEADPNQLRYGVSTEQRKRNLEEFQKAVPGADRTVDLSTEEGRANAVLFGGRRVGMTPQQREQIELGMANADPGAAQRAIHTAQAAPGDILAREAERIQAERASEASARQFRLLRVGAGTASAAERATVAEESSPELKRSIDALNETLKQQRAAVGGFQFLGSQERAEAAVRETQEKIMTIRAQTSQLAY